MRNNRKRRTTPVENLLSLLLCVLLGVETLLCYLELHPQRFVELLHPTLSVCKISCYDGPRQLQKITKMYEKSLILLEQISVNVPGCTMCAQICLCLYKDLEQQGSCYILEMTKINC